MPQQDPQAERLDEEPNDAGPEGAATVPDDDTVQADRRDATVAGRPDRMPTPEEEAAAPTEVDPAVAESYEEALERGANVRGEGRV
jgi:hypothetical protein